MDSSPDLSLKLRRGSSDSRDSFYMDFAQGIDSDIEEVDTTNTTRAPQQPPTPPLPEAVSELTSLQLSGTPLLSKLPLASQPLPTLSESDDLPPTPPPHQRSIAELTKSTPPKSEPQSPTSSVLEMIPPPPLPMSPIPPKPPTRAQPSPPIETEDEGDDDDEPTPYVANTLKPAVAASPTSEEKVVENIRDDGDDDEHVGDEEEDEEEEGDDDKSSPPPPLAPLPSNLSYVHGNGAHRSALPASQVTPPMTRSPSTSPSPPDTPPPCPRPKSLGRMVSPPPPPQMQPLTPPSESDQSQPNSPPPLPPHHAMNMLSASPPQPSSPKSGEERIGDICLSTPPPEFGEADEMVVAALAAAVEASSQELVNGGQWEHAAVMAQGGEEQKSLYDDESTTITTPPSNGFSASSIMLPAGITDQLGELEADARLILDDIPPPEEIIELEERSEADEESEAKTPVLEPAKVSEAYDEEPSAEELPGTPTPHATPTPIHEGTVESPKTSGSVSGSRGPSRSISRSGSRSGSRNASRSGSVRGSIASRAASIASATIPPVTLTSPPTSIKSLRSPPSVSSKSSSKSSTGSVSKKSPPAALKSPPPALQSPAQADSPPTMPSPPIMRSSPQSVKSPPPEIHSPPMVSSPPKLHSPKLVQADRHTVTFKQPLDIQELRTETATDSLPSSAATPPPAKPPLTSVTSSTTKAISAGSAAAAATTLSFQDEHIATRPHLSSHHHYHLPHHFQHPHHQNHHTHGSVPVPTPTIPASFKLHSTSSDAMGVAAAMGGGGGGDGGPGGRRSPSPPAAASSSTNLLLATDSTSHASASPAKSTSRLRDSSSHHRVTIDESSLPPSSSSTHHPLGGGSDDPDSEPSSPASSSHQQVTHLSGGDGDDRQTGHLALMYHSHQLTSYPVLPAIKRTHRPSFVYPPMPRVKAGDALATLFSALYGKLLVVMGIAFPMAEVISTYIPPSFYEVYYLYLYIGSMIFLLFMYATLIWGRPKLPVNIASPTKSTTKTRNSTSASESLDESDTDSNSTRNKHLPPVITSARRPSLLAPLGRQHHYGSFYLRMGAVAFGIGSMIYSGLEFGQYFELNPDTKCHNVLLALTPATRMAFIFIQMYFIFLNNEQIKVYRYKIIARFGLMHMIGTNLAVWLNVLIQETKHEILTFYNPENRTLRISHRIPGHSRGQHVVVHDSSAHLRVPRGLKGPYQIFECRRTNIIGTLVQDASPFLFPCTIEYSLICAAILYVMWRSISRPQSSPQPRPDQTISPMKRSPHHYSVDCARAHKGLFVGILILVLTIISLILFFVLISRPDFVSLAVTEVTICELLIYGTTTIATMVGMIQIRNLQYDAYRSFSLDDILLVGAQTGSFLYNIFTVIAGHFTLRSDDMLVPINALASIVQTACQTMFILDASRRQAVSPDHIRKKPGREIVTFMLVVNLAMWAISTLEKSRAESHPIQLNFYGLWAWTIITHVSMPLAIFYRFHSTVCLCEIWKRAYKLKPTYM